MEYHYKSKDTMLSFRLSRKRAIVLTAVIVISVAAALLATVYPWPITSVGYNNVILQFGVNLRDARNVPVYPNANAVANVINVSRINGVTFVLQNTSDDYSSKVEAVEIVLKLSTAYNIFDTNFYDPNSNHEPLIVKSFDNLNATQRNPYIVLVPPSISDGNYVKVVGNSVFISGKTQHDFDLATAKFILSSIGISI